MLPIEMHPPPYSSSSSSSSSSSHVIPHPDPNWLAFSLSNNHNDHSDPTPFSLFRPFNPSPEQEPRPPHPSSSSSTAHLSILSGSGPEFSDFLGVVPLSATPCFPPPPSTEEVPAPGIYDASDLKTITASFPRGFSSDASRGDREYQPEPQRQQELQLLASEGQQQQQAGKKAVDTFGQRTSIYRGVTR